MTPRRFPWLLALSLALPLAPRAGDVKIEVGASMPAGPVGQNNLKKIEPIPTVGGSLETPLDAKTGVEMAGANAAGTIPALPDAAVKAGQPGTTAHSPRPGAGEWDAELILKNGQAAVVPVAPHRAVEPYFVGALTRLGVPQDLAAALAEYQASRHPGDQDKVYHGLGHSQDVPAAVSAILENLPDGAMTERQKVLLIVAAVLHDIDPQRKPETPARVSATLPYLEMDPASVAILAEFGRRYGITTAQVQALIKATDFNMDPAAQKAISEDFESRVRSSFPAKEQAWALDWGRKLSFADKSATYLGSVEAADRQVRNLANEIRKAVEAATGQAAPDREEVMLRASSKFLKVLRDSPDYAILPASLQRNFEKVYAHFERLADPSVPIPSENAQPRGPPATADLAIRRLSLGLEATDRDLANLKTAGFAVLAPGALMDAETERRVLDIVERDWIKNGQPVFSQLPFNDRSQPLWGPRMASVRAELDPVVENLTRRLNSVLTGEGIAVRDVQLRLATPEEPEKQVIHVDLAPYITATYALRGRGTVLFRISDGLAQAREAPTHSWALVTNAEREAATGIPGTVHDIPLTDRPRVLLIVRFTRTGPELPKDRLAAARERSKARADGVARQLARQGRKPEKSGLLGSLTRIFGE
ncbi:MAG: hypothetical protein HY077_06460 [Elusimicrobia bacterium]|nr:hypothetical protein [Elusimicrobiota bacterium]